MKEAYFFILFKLRVNSFSKENLKVNYEMDKIKYTKNCIFAVKKKKEIAYE